jgi:hypothetical protein
MFKVKLSGMGEYEIKLNSLVSEKLILSNLDKATKEIGNEIENRISARYNSKGLSSQKPIYSPIFKEGSKFSKTISYMESVQNAGIFITKREVGNIEPKAGKKRIGVIHYIDVYKPIDIGTLGFTDKNGINYFMLYFLGVICTSKVHQMGSVFGYGFIITQFL